MYCSIKHITRFRYSAPITQSIMELRMEPRTEGIQRCLSFKLTLNPTANIMIYRDYLGNVVHNFDIPGQHRSLTITAEAQVEMKSAPELPERLAPETWDELDTSEFDNLLPSSFTHPTPLLDDLAHELNITRRDDPLTLLRELNTAIYDAFEYGQEVTKVDSPIDDALRARSGVCQDFSHIMLALLRPLGIPCRYVSGYLYTRGDKNTRSAEDASHAWVEALLPKLGWIGFDPTNNLIAGERHIRVAVGRDYADVPPTRGVFKGRADTELAVGVRVALADEVTLPDLIPGVGVWAIAPELVDEGEAGSAQQ
ncbi:MAG: transglutaminase family protein [Anaerolineae bacterium]|nr:transglutaminase family protein [Anaerolineae bacterium]